MLFPKSFLISLVSIILSIGVFVMVVLVSGRLMSQCVTKDHWDTSLQHYFKYTDITGSGTKYMMPVSVEDFYKDRLSCIIDNKFMSPDASYQRQLELLPRLQLVERVHEDDRPEGLCVELTTGKDVCVKY